MLPPAPRVRDQSSGASSPGSPRMSSTSSSVGSGGRRTRSATRAKPLRDSSTLSLRSHGSRVTSSGKSAKSRSRVSRASAPWARQRAATRASCTSGPRTRWRVIKRSSRSRKPSVSPSRRLEGDSVQARSWAHALVGRRRRVAPDAPVRHNTQKLVEAGPGDGPGQVALGQRPEHVARGLVEGRLPAMRVYQDVGVYRDQGASGCS